mmetsp:Transcript_26873/g.56149  ORF Transcript_26873/g.56149 Transcript_26873/m.56149 type:complete len:259 (-) Transcript_26873:1639-2415(-)
MEVHYIPVLPVVTVPCPSPSRTLFRPQLLEVLQTLSGCISNLLHPRLGPSNGGDNGVVPAENVVLTALAFDHCCYHFDCLHLLLPVLFLLAVEALNRLVHYIRSHPVHARDDLSPLGFYFFFVVIFVALAALLGQVGGDPTQLCDAPVQLRVGSVAGAVPSHGSHDFLHERLDVCLDDLPVPSTALVQVEVLHLGKLLHHVPGRQDGAAERRVHPLHHLLAPKEHECHSIRHHDGLLGDRNLGGSQRVPEILHRPDVA